AAMELADWSVSLTPAGNRNERHRRIVAAADYHFAAFDLAEARRLLEAAVAELPAGTLRAEALVRLANVPLSADRSDAAAAIVSQAIDEAGDEPALLVVAHQTKAAATWNSGNLPAVVPHVEAALALAKRIEDAELVAENAALLALAEFVLAK